MQLNLNGITDLRDAKVGVGVADAVDVSSRMA